jgi:hypothetical protein
VLAARAIPETKDEDAADRLDVAGIVLAAGGLAALTWGLTEGPAVGWGLAPLAALVAGLVLFVAFLAVEGRVTAPLMPLTLFSSRQFSAANIVTLVVYAALAGALFLIPVQLQVVSGFSPLAAGSTLLPVTAVMLLLSARAGRVAQRIGPRLPMTVGPIVAGAGLALLTRVGAGSGYLGAVLPALLVFALGLSVTVAPLTATVLAAAPARRVGVASAVNNDIARTAGLFAVAVVPGLAGITPAAYRNPAALSAGFHHAVLISAGLCVAGGVLSALTIRNDLPGPSAAREAGAHVHSAVPCSHVAHGARAEELRPSS